MVESHVMSGLIAKRCDLAGELVQFEKEIKRISAGMEALDVAIKLFDPDYDLRKLKAKRKFNRNTFFKNGEASRLILDLLRTTDRPLNTVELAYGAAKAKGINLETANQNALKACILTVLSRLRTNGTIMEVGRGDNQTIRWSLSSGNQ